jgi:REP element-mobilizing transposase RayT
MRAWERAPSDGICDNSGNFPRQVAAIFAPMEQSHKLWHRRGYLPHFDQGAVVQAITFRLADSLPREFYESLASRTPTVRSQGFETHMDQGRGACILADPDYAKIVQGVLNHFDGERYRLLAWVIMPNHVHSVVEQIPGHRLGDVVRSWKNYSARRINALSNKSGAVWAPDYFDRFIRNEDHLANAIRYVEDNPVKAGLVSNPAEWIFSFCAARHGSSAAAPPCASGDARSQ